MLRGQAPPPMYAQANCQGPGGYSIQDDLSVKDPKPEDIASGGWEVCPGKVLMPATFCGWSPSSLPPAQLKTCYALHRKVDPADYKPEWKRFEADNGAVFVLDMKSVSHPHYCRGCADAVMCTVDNNQCIPPNMTRIRFDCHGHYLNIDGGGELQMAPPRSVVGQMAVVACVGGQND